MRLPDWQQRLAVLVKSRQKDFFEPGRNDCCLFAADVVVAVLGVDPGEPYRGKYTMLPDGFVLMRKVCGGGIDKLIQFMADTHGFEEISPIFAQRGDIGLYEDPKIGDTLGACLGSVFGFLRTDSGLAYIERELVRRAWRVS